MSSTSESSGHDESEEENENQLGGSPRCGSGMGERVQPQKNPFECPFEALKTYAKAPLILKNLFFNRWQS